MLAIFERRSVRILAYLIFIVITLLSCLAITFPDERIKEIIIVQAEKQLNKGKDRSKRNVRIWEVNITDLDLWWFSGIELHNVVLQEKWSEERKQRALDEASDGAPPQKPMTVRIPRVAVRASLLSSLINLGGAGVFQVDFNSDGNDGGLVKGLVIARSDGIFIDAELDNLDMYRAAVIESATGVPAFGYMNGTASFIFDPQTGLPVDGTIDLSGNKLSIGPAEVKTDKLPSMAYLEVPRTSLGNLTFKGHVERRGKTPAFVFDNFNAKGLDVHMQIWGDLELSAKAGQSNSNISMRLQFNEEFVQENSLGPILNIQTLRSGRNGEGWYGISFKGRMSRMKPRGDLNAAKGPSKTKAANTKTDDAASNAKAADTKAADTKATGPTIKNKVKKK